MNLTLHEVTAVARGRRRDLGLSQLDVARRLGVSRGWLHDFEQGAGGASLDTVLRLMDVLGLQLAFVEGQAPSQDEVDLDQLLTDHSG